MQSQSPSVPATRTVVRSSIGAARDRMQSAHRDLNRGDTTAAIVCVMQALNHVAVAVDMLADDHD